jgi:hypothetical protein
MQPTPWQVPNARLFLPRQVVLERQRSPAAPHLGVTIGTNELTGRRATVVELTQVLARFRRPDVIRWIAAIGGWVTRDGSLEPNTQLALAEHLLSPERRSELIRAIQHRNDRMWCVFHRRPLWLVLQFALIASSDSAPVADEAVIRTALGDCILMANDLFDQGQVNNPIGEGADAANKWVIAHLMPLFDGRDRHEIAARALGMWFEATTSDSVKRQFKSRGADSFEDAFAKAHGLPLRDFLRILFTLYAVCSAHSNEYGVALLVNEADLWPYFGEELYPSRVRLRFRRRCPSW